MAAMVVGQEIPIYGRRLSTKETTSVGVIQYSEGQARYEIIDDKVAEPMCLGTQNVENCDCFAVVDDLSNKQFVIQLNQQAEIEYLSVQTIETKRKGVREQVIVRAGRVIPEPNLSPNNQPKGKPKPTAKVVGEGEEGGEEAPTSWVQKNWMYIIPPLLIMFVLLGDEK